MARIPASASVALAGLLPAYAAALGLGEIESRSYLNQPLSAEIPVFSDAAGEIAGLSVALASPDTFAQYGLPTPAMSGDLRFSVEPDGRGGRIRITSTQPVSEPFLTLLIEVKWPQGRLLREFTVLLDPPDFASAAVEQPVQKAAEVAAPRARPVAPAPAEDTATAAPPAPPSPSAQDTEGSHRVARDEALWSIARRYRPDTAISINQVMVSIYRANPEAFAGNVNRLRAGSVLRIPDAADMRALGRAEAAAEVQRQNEEWRGQRAAPVESPARLELVPPPEAPATAAPVAPARPAEQAPAAVQAELEENRRLLAVKDAELKALRDRIAALEQQGREVAVEPAPVQPETAAEAEAVATEPAPAATPAVPAKPPKAAPVPVKEEGSGIVGTLVGLLTSVWLWIAAAVVLVGALLFARRRAGAEEAAPWRPPAGRASEEESSGSTMIVQEEPARASGRFDRRALVRGDEELPLERTISTESPVNLDQADPLAEADFHMAYGLYDQAADLLTAALGREPARRDLRLKLLDVLFVWENRESFVKEARALRERVGSEADPDWKRVLIMGKQLCPNEALFAGGASQAAEDMDLAFSGDSGGTVDLEIGSGGGGLDLDFGLDEGGEVDSSASTKVVRPSWGGGTAQTQEVPTIEAPALDLASTRETPTVENPSLSSTLETPTIETRAEERTLETPTLRTTSPDASATARLRISGAGEERADQTAEIDLEDLGLDLTGLDDAARDMATGLQEALPADAAGLDFDLSAGDTGLEGEESTAEMEKGAGLEHLTNAISKSGSATRATGDDTVDQPGSSLISPSLSATSDDIQALNIDLDLGGTEPSQSDLTATGLRTLGVRGPEDPTMTEVGTKLDLARAYLDMGDPDGARSILNEVVEEGDPAQRQEARQLLDGLDR